MSGLWRTTRAGTTPPRLAALAGRTRPYDRHSPTQWGAGCGDRSSGAEGVATIGPERADRSRRRAAPAAMLVALLLALWLTPPAPAQDLPAQLVVTVVPPKDAGAPRPTGSLVMSVNGSLGRDDPARAGNRAADSGHRRSRPARFALLGQTVTISYSGDSNYEASDGVTVTIPTRDGLTITARAQGHRRAVDRHHVARRRGALRGRRVGPRDLRLRGPRRPLGGHDVRGPGRVGQRRSTRPRPARSRSRSRAPTRWATRPRRRSRSRSAARRGAANLPPPPHGRRQRSATRPRRRRRPAPSAPGSPAVDASRARRRARLRARARRRRTRSSSEPTSSRAESRPGDSPTHAECHGRRQPRPAGGVQAV